MAIHCLSIHYIQTYMHIDFEHLNAMYTSTSISDTYVSIFGYLYTSRYNWFDSSIFRSKIFKSGSSIKYLNLKYFISVMTGSALINNNNEKINTRQVRDKDLLNDIYNPQYTIIINFSTKKLAMYTVYTDVGGIKQLYHVCPPVRKIIHSLKLVDYRAA